MFPGAWFAYMLFTEVTDEDRYMRPLFAITIGIAGCTMRAIVAALMTPPWGKPRYAEIHRVFLDSMLTVAAILVASLATSSVADAIHDPIGGWNAPNCVPGDGFSIPSGRGNVAALHTMDCDEGLAGWQDIKYVFVHHSGEQNTAANLAFRYLATDRGDLPSLRWSRAHTLTISLRPNDVREITMQRLGIGGTQIVYDIRAGCTAADERVISNGQSKIAVLRTTSCAIGSNSNIYCIHSIFVENRGERRTRKKLAFQYEPTTLGMEFDSPTIAWKNIHTLVVRLKHDDIQKSSRRLATLAGVQIHYEIGGR